MTDVLSPTSFSHEVGSRFQLDRQSSTWTALNSVLATKKTNFWQELTDALIGITSTHTDRRDKHKLKCRMSSQTIIKHASKPIISAFQTYDFLI